MTLFCSCTKSNNKKKDKKKDNVLDISIHNPSLVKDKKINLKKDNNCNIFSIFNIFWCESIEENKDLH